MNDQEFVTDNIVENMTKIGSRLFRVRCSDYGPDDNTCEPVEHLLRSHIVNYFRLHKLQLPTQRALAKVMPVGKT